MTDFLRNNDFKVAWSSNRVSGLEASLDPDWQDANVCIDSERVSLLGPRLRGDDKVG